MYKTYGPSFFFFYDRKSNVGTNIIQYCSGPINHHYLVAESSKFFLFLIAIFNAFLFDAVKIFVMICENSTLNP